MSAHVVRIISGSRGQAAAVHALLRRGGYRGAIVTARSDYPHDPQAVPPDEEEAA